MTPKQTSGSKTRQTYKKKVSRAEPSSASFSSTHRNTPEGSDTRGPGPAPVSGQAFTPGLYLVATPIGNARDITLRALDLLGAADVIACEDTRVTAKLLAIHGIRAPLLAYHDHNARTQGRKIIERLKAGEIVALVSDAGTPMISDPGFGLVRQALGEGMAVTALPGASSVLTGLQLAALPTDRFFFQGFLPPKTTARKTALAEIAAVPASLVFLESPKRLAGALADMAQVLGARDAAVLREMTKKFEEARRDPLPVLAEHYAQADTPRGEVVVVVGPPDASTAIDPAGLDALILEALQSLSVRDAAARIAAETGVRKKDVYDRALALAKEQAE